jgi:hypothetical protein
MRPSGSIATPRPRSPKPASPLIEICQIGAPSGASRATKMLAPSPATYSSPVTRMSPAASIATACAMSSPESGPSHALDQISSPSGVYLRIQTFAFCPTTNSSPTTPTLPDGSTATPRARALPASSPP